MYNYLSKVVSVKNNSKDIFYLFFNEILKKVKRKVENIQIRFTILFIVETPIPKAKRSRIDKL